MAESLIDKVLGGCRIVRRLRRGGMSSIYLAHQETVERDVVLKVLSPGLLGDETFMTRFSREVETTARLQHPHIIPIFDYGEQDGQPYIVMAYIPGGSLDDLIAMGPVKLDEATRIIGQVADALDFAHEHGVIHRDIKPGNILLDGQRNAILTDFGIAKVIADTQDVTRDAIVGTFAYIAPETVDRNNPLTPAADVYSLAVTLFQALTGDTPFPGETSARLMWSHVNEPAPLAAPRRPDLPEAIDMVLQKALAKTPLARYHTCGEMVKDLKAVAVGSSPDIAWTEPPPTLAVERSTPPTTRMEDAVGRAIDQVVKIMLPDGSNGSGCYLPGDQIVTCLHVVDGAAGIYVRFRTGEQIEADVVATAPKRDLALLKLRAAPTSLPAKELGGIRLEAAKLEPGEVLAAIGHPLGLDWSVTGGHYNAVRQPGEDPLPRFGIVLSVPLVQVDVTINAGNSGGPIIDAEGRLVGLADSIINPAIANNIGFAIEAGAVWSFWKENREASNPMVAYDCGHHHPAGDEPYCPFTGKPAKPLTPVPMPTATGVRYSCGHIHPPGLVYCPLTGKPAHPLDEAPDKTQVAPALKTEEVEIICTNCKHHYPASQSHCPRCGKPRRKVPAD